MAVTLKDDFAKEQKQWVKRAMKGRPLYFGLQAKAAKKGKFLVSKKPGQVKPAKVKELEPYEADGKDQKKAADKNKIPGGASMGVCQGENGTLKLYFERGKALPVAEKFVKFFVTREVKFKLVKKVRIVEVDQLPTVPEEDESDKEPVTAQSVEVRVKELAQRSQAVGGDGYGLPERLNLARELPTSNPGQADDALDEIEFVIGTLERAKELQDQLTATAGEAGVAKELVAAIAKQIGEALKLVKAENSEGADDALDVAEQSIANLRKAAGLPESGAPSPDAPGMSKVDDEKAAAFFTDWLEGIKPDLKTLKDAKAVELKEIGEHVKAVSAAAGKKDWKSAAEEYKKADKLITAAISGLRTRPDEDSAREFRAAWEQAIKQFRTSLGELEGELIALAEALAETDDDDLYWVASEGLPDLLKEIRAVANGMLQIQPSTPVRTAANASPIFRELRSVMHDERVAACDDNEFGVATRIRHRLGESLELFQNAVMGVR